jgi:UDP-N-acetylglucosamine 2-epimerase (non-hydrolysing)/GDP/UDP-N,N'-diacetylbacillosamine 2-epimerase (hydrolysing)
MALTEDFRRSLQGMENPYGDGHAAERIVSVLTSAPLGEKLLIKRAPAVESEMKGQSR